MPLVKVHWDSNLVIIRKNRRSFKMSANRYKPKSNEISLFKPNLNAKIIKFFSLACF